MIEIQGDFWDEAGKYDILLVTTCGHVRNDGNLTMGKGIALEFKEKFPFLPKILGEHVTKRGNVPFYFNSEQWKIISFPTKYYWLDKSDFDLIERSANIIKELVNYHSLKTILSTRPGCGLGRLKWEDVKPIIEPSFDDRFTIISL